MAAGLFPAAVDNSMVQKIVPATQTEGIAEIQLAAQALFGLLKRIICLKKIDRQIIIYSQPFLIYK